MIAALPLHGVPSLIGDFILTDTATARPHIFLPTRPDLNSPLFRHLGRRVVALRRKIHIFNTNFVAGFSGSLPAGQAIFTELERQFSKRVPTIVDLDNVLRQFNTRYSGNAIVVGWTRVSRPVGFSWSASKEATVRQVSQEIVGSGTAHFKGLLSDPAATGYSDAVTTAWDKAVLLGLSKIGRLMIEELSSAANLEQAYGFGAQLVLLSAGGFRAVEKVTMLFWNVRIERDGSIQYVPANVIATYEDRGRYTVAQIVHLTLGGATLSASATHLGVITPIHDEIRDLDARSIGRLDASAPYYFFGFSVLDVESGRSATFANVVPNESGVLRHTKRNGLDYFEFNRNDIEPILRSIFSTTS